MHDIELEPGMPELHDTCKFHVAQLASARDSQQASQPFEMAEQQHKSEDRHNLITEINAGSQKRRCLSGYEPTISKCRHNFARHLQFGSRNY